MSFEVDIPTTEEVLAAVFSSSLPALPPQEQRLGSSTVSWWETGPGEAYVHAEGGTGDDRHYARSLVTAELEAHGYAPAQFDLDVIHPESRRTASWVDPAIISHMDSVPMYHVAPPQSERQYIEGDNGLWAGESPELSEEGVYTFDHPTHAQRFAEQHPELHPFDIWEIGVSPEDRQAMTEDPMEDGGWLLQEPFLEAQNLKRLA